ncbi:MAG: EAL domain-containing protein [Gallionellaceae bacterium]
MLNSQQPTANSQQPTANKIMLRKYLGILIGWTLLIGGSLLWNLHELDKNTLSNAAAVARASLAKDIGFRDWAASHGGVYVQPSAHTPPNPYLKVPGRDVVTTTGMKLTLMNPAFVIREVQEDFNGNKMDLSHLTSLKLLNPNNKPDEWEIKALKSFDQGAKEVMEIADIGDATYMRLMKPLPVIEGCLKCHAVQGYKVGDVRGGIGAYVKMRPFTNVQLSRIHDLSFSHGLIWLIGLIGLGGMFGRERSVLVERMHADQVAKFRTKTLEMLASNEPLGDILKAIVLGVEEVNPKMLCSLLLLDSEGKHLVTGAAPSLPDFYNEAINGVEIGMGVGSCGTAAFTGERVIVEIIQTHPYWAPYKALAARANLDACWSQPILSSTGKVLGTFAIYHRIANTPTQEDLSLIERSAHVASVAIEKRQADAAIHDLAFYDTLTNLPNRRLLLDRLKECLLSSARSQRYGALLFIDLDNFKTLNDTLGHEYGDLLLIATAKRIQTCVREVDTVARLGGDDFVVLLAEVDADVEVALQTVALLAEKMRTALTTPYQLIDKEYLSSTSIGVSLYRGNEMTVSELLKHTDMAMYRAKESGRNAVRFFDAEMQLAVEAHAALEADLRRAVPEQQLQLYYQVQVNSEQKPIGAEALVRWIHPTRGMVSPAQFIPLAEESSLILVVGDWVMEAACRQLAVWSKAEHSSHLTLAVNVSAKQFKQSDFVEKVKNLIHDHELDASRLKIELTETVVLTDVTEVITKMHALKALRVRLSMDDFGTGYSSLSYLKQLPLDQLKIDQSFVRDMTSDQNDQVMVQTIIDMAKNFHLNVIAEGVETEAQLSLLKHLGCLAYQGYLFSKPVPIEHFEALLKPI